MPSYPHGYLNSPITHPTSVAIAATQLIPVRHRRPEEEIRCVCVGYQQWTLILGVKLVKNSSLETGMCMQVDLSLILCQGDRV